jgi:ribosomal protein S18 acetylase RimI-like enzyme
MSVARRRSRRLWHALSMPISIDDSLLGIKWPQAKVDLAADEFDNGRSAEALRRSFEHSQVVAIARDGDRVVGMARLLSDRVCNAYLLDVWTASSHRRQGIASQMVLLLTDRVPGQHIGLQTDNAQPFYLALGFRRQPEFMSLIVGNWLGNEGNR